MSTDRNGVLSTWTDPTLEKLMVEILNSSTRKVLSNEQLCSKINTFRNLCFANKINSSNVFDLNMAEYFHKWLKKKNQEGKLTQENLFQDLSDYLDTTGKIYSCRIDSANNSMNSLYEKLRMEGLIKKNTNNLLDNGSKSNERPVNKRNKRTRAMITTSDKLRGNPIDSYSTLKTPFDLMELTKVGRPSEYFLSMFHNITFAEQFKMDLEKSKKVVQSSDKFTMKNLTKKFKEFKEICPELSDLMTEYNMLPCNKDSNLDYIEDCFNPDDDPLINSMNNETSMDYDNYNDLGEYSKVPTSSLDDFDDDHESIPKKVKQSKNKRKVTENKDLDKWLNTEQINSTMSNLITSNEQVLPQTCAKWHSFSNVEDPLLFKVEHKFSFLEYLKIKPDSLILPSDEENMNISDEKDNFPENFALNDDQDNDGMVVDNADEDFDNDINVNDNILQKSSDDEDYDDIPIKETKLDVTVLKTEIMNIINQECKFLLISDYSTGISFYKLLKKLNAFEREIPLALIYVAILHLNNEKRFHILRTGSDGDIAKGIFVKFKKP